MTARAVTMAAMERARYISAGPTYWRTRSMSLVARVITSPVG